MKPRFGVVFPLWSFEHDSDLLERAFGEIGFEELVVPVVTGPVRSLLVRTADGPRAFTTEGGWHFPPESRNYAGAALRPRTARWCGKRNVLSRITAFASGHGLALTFRVDLRRAPHLVEQHEHVRQRNAWGDEGLDAGACVSNAEIAALLRETVTDVAQYAPRGVELVDWAPDVHAAPSSAVLGWSRTARTLLDLCFCPSCRQVAASGDVDPDQAARSTRVFLETFLHEPGDTDLIDRIREDRVLAAYQQLRREACGRSVEHLADHVPDCAWRILATSEASLSRLPTLSRAPAGLALDDRAEADEVTYGVPCRDLELPGWWPRFRQSDELVRFVTGLCESGVEQIAFRGLEAAPEEAVTWVRQAVRFARRG